MDSGDRLRMEDCREELHALLQEQVRIRRVALTYYNTNDSVETGWRISIGVCEQTGYHGIYVRC